MHRLLAVLIFSLIFQTNDLVSAQEIDKDVEIIPGKAMPQPDQQRLGFGRMYYIGDYYGPQVSDSNIFLC